MLDQLLLASISVFLALIGIKIGELTAELRKQRRDDEQARHRAF